MCMIRSELLIIFNDMSSKPGAKTTTGTRPKMLLDNKSHGKVVDELRAALGHAGTVIAFRVRAQDAPEISRQLGDLLPIDLIRLPNHSAYVQLMIDGEKSRPFSMRTWPPPIP